MAVNRMPVDPDTGIPELIQRLGDDSKRLASDEFRLAKLEVRENLKRGGKETMWLGAAFGVGVVALMALTLCLITLIGRLASGHMWIGALVVGALEIVVGIFVLRYGLSAFKEPSYSLVETRESLKDTKAWISAVRS